MRIQRIDLDLTVCKVADVKDLDLGLGFYFIGRTDQEISLVCETDKVPARTIAREDGWKAFRLQGPLDFSLIGILSKITGILAENGIGIFAVSTFDTDYILVKKENYERALQVLAERGYEVEPREGSGRKKKIVAFICTHNACRSQMAEALAKNSGFDGYEFYSAGSVPEEHIDPGAVRIMKKYFGIDMSSQYSKTVKEIPAPDIAISMGCGVKCPYIGRAFDDDWGLPDPTGKSDAAYLRVIDKIRAHLKVFEQ